jgi:hypothetical protein
VAGGSAAASAAQGNTSNMHANGIEEKNVGLAVFECLAALAGVRQLRPVELLQEKISSHWEQEASPACLQAMRTIFFEVAFPGVPAPASFNSDTLQAVGVDLEAIKAHLAHEQKYGSEIMGGRVGGQSTERKLRPVSTLARLMLQKYPQHHLPNSRLSFHGFLQYYVDQCQHTEAPLWSVLRAYGFRNDLSRLQRNPAASAVERAGVEDGLGGVAEETKEEVIMLAPAGGSGASGEDSGTPVDCVTVSTTDGDSATTTAATLNATNNAAEPLEAEYPPFLVDADYPTAPVRALDLSMSPASASVLACPALYASGMAVADGPTKTLAQCACYGSLERTNTLVCSALARLLQAASNNEPMPVEASLDLLGALLQVKDDLQEERATALLEDAQAGILTVIKAESLQASNCALNRFSASTLKDRYCGYLASLCVNKGLYRLLQALAAEEAETNSVYRHLRLRGQDCSILEKERIELVSVTLQAAGVAGVNGTYEYVGTKHGAGVYERRAPHTTLHADGTSSTVSDARYMIYKCEVKNSAKQWFISVVQEGMDPGTTADVDLYYAIEDKRQAAIFGRTLPPVQWVAFAQHKTTELQQTPKGTFSWPQGSDADLDPAAAAAATSIVHTQAYAGAGTGTGTRASYAGNGSNSFPVAQQSYAYDSADDDDLYAVPTVAGVVEAGITDLQNGSANSSEEFKRNANYFGESDQ